MTTATLSYAETKAAVDSGIFVAFAAGTLNGEPATVWIAAMIDGPSAAVAHSSNDRVRAAQGVGAISHLRRHARHLGFTPA